MHTMNIALFSPEGQVAEAIIDLLSPHYKVHQFFFSGNNLSEAITVENDSIKNLDVIIINLYEVHSTGKALLAHLIEMYSVAPVIVLHIYHQKTFAEEFIRMGAKAYLSVTFNTEDLLTAIEEVTSENIYFGKNIT